MQACKGPLYLAISEAYSDNLIVERMIVETKNIEVIYSTKLIYK